MEFELANERRRLEPFGATLDKHSSHASDNRLGVSRTIAQACFEVDDDTLEKEMKKILTYAAAACCLVTLASVAQARSAYDGSWDLVFVTQRGACDATYNFSVNINGGIVTHPNLVRFRG
jgi:hypothetical protein